MDLIKKFDAGADDLPLGGLAGIGANYRWKVLIVQIHDKILSEPIAELVLTNSVALAQSPNQWIRHAVAVAFAEAALIHPKRRPQSALTVLLP